MKSLKEEGTTFKILDKDEKLKNNQEVHINKELSVVNFQDDNQSSAPILKKKRIKRIKISLPEDPDLNKLNRIINKEPQIPFKLELFSPIEKPKITPIEIIDCLFQYPEQYQLFVLNEKIYNLILKQNDKTELQRYIICQILESKTKNSEYLLYIRSGNVGGNSKSMTTKFKNSDLALKKFKFLCDYWIKRGYDQEGEDFLNMINLNQKPSILKQLNFKSESKLLKRSFRKSKLEKNLQIILEKMLINTNKDSRLLLNNSGFDFDKLPYSKISKNRISLGNRQLSKISNVIENSLEGNLFELSQNFFESIPHVFGVKNLYDFVINSKSKLDVELEIMENLERIRISNKLISNIDGSFNYLLDSFYEKLKIKINIIHKKTEEFKILDLMVRNTKGPTHNFICEIINAFKIERPIDKLKYLKNIGNDHLLFFSGKFQIFSKFFLPKNEGKNEGSDKSDGLHIGISFSDVITNAASASKAQTNEQNGFILVCKVALGNITYHLDPEDKKIALEDNKNSRVILGKFLPDPMQKN